MRVYRGNIKEFASNTYFPFRVKDGVYYSDGYVNKAIFQPQLGSIVHTGPNFVSVSGPITVAANSYYRFDGIYPGSEYVKWTPITEEQAQANAVISVFDIMECTYSGQDMGKRSVTATIKFATPIDFRIGDYIQIPMQNLLRGNGKAGSTFYEKFYIYTEPQCKKTARPMSTGDAFETTVVFHPRQYELSTIQMRDFINNPGDGTPIIYTGFDEVTFYGGAHELLERCMACLRQQFVDYDGNDLWHYELANEVNEDINTALERIALSFSGQSVMDALLKLNDKEGINTTFFINDRTIYVGYKRPYFCKVDNAGTIEDKPLRMMYGKTSHEAINLDHGGLYDITKTVGEELPITKLYAYGAARNLNRYYCADRIQSGRFVNKLMLPSFSDDGVTDYVISEDAVKKYGKVEGSKNFEEIYPSLRYMTYADIRGVKYCIKIKGSGLSSDPSGKLDHINSLSSCPIARVQCYKVVPSGTTGVNTLVEAAPPEDLAIFIHSESKVVKVVLYGGTTDSEAINKQRAHDVKVPTRDGNTDYIPGSCFCVHDPGFEGSSEDRTHWFDTPTATTDLESNIHRIEYVDTYWLTDLYVFESYNQTNFRRDGYSAWAWPRLNGDSPYPDSTPVNEVVSVEPVVIPDTSENIEHGRQQHFDIYLRDLGFGLDEQNDFGEMVFVFNTPVVSVLDGMLAGREFEIDGGENLNDYTDRVVCAYNQDGTLNDEFFYPGDSGDSLISRRAFSEGAIWRVRLNRNNKDDEKIGLIIPNTTINMSAGDRIVLLDIYMPDIYVRAAENRLLREARKFLDSNDRGNVKYAISFDKVRIQQIPNYAKQMREGVMLRVVDDDLKITSDNTTRTLVDYANGHSYDVPLFTESHTTEEIEEYTWHEYYKDDEAGIPKFSEMHKWVPDPSATALYGRITIYVQKNTNAATIDVSDIELMCSYRRSIVSTQADLESISIADLGERWGVSFNIVSDSNLTYQDLKFSKTVYLRVKETVVRTEYHKEKDENVMPAICKDLIEFKGNKHYEVIIDVENTRWINDIKLTTSSADTLHSYTPEDYTCEDITDRTVESGFYRKKYSFYLPDSFNDAVGYYVATLYSTAGVDYGRIKMVSVIEKDLNEDGNKVDYVDFKVSNVTIKITDNTRPDDTRIMGAYPEPIYDIQAQITEQTKASAWGQLMNEMQQMAIEVEQAHKTYESLAQAARLNYQRLLALRNNIFDPDGTIKDVFLQTMMLQVGADSMNYQLDRTYSDAAGNRYNFAVTDKSGNTPAKFTVGETDTLRHFVYVQGGQGGTWTVPGRFTCNLVQVNGEYPVYYVCLKCRKNVDNFENDVVWVCDTVQHAVNEDPDYWYFNWGILTPNGNGNYSFSETRGNAYMYGDNIIAGKISTIAGNSYFDLTHGHFVLSNGTTTALSYENGVLTIGALNDASGIGKAIHDLGLDVDTLKDQEIGGANLYSGVDPLVVGVSDVVNKANTDVLLEDGKKYVISINSLSGGNATTFLRAYSYDRRGNTLLGTIKTGAANGGKETLVVTGGGKYLHFAAEPFAVGSSVTYTLSGIMVQQGNKATAYSTYYQHLTNALKGSTEVAGGLVMTNLLMLKNEQGNVVSGISGLTGTSQTPENVAMWADATYEEALYASNDPDFKKSQSGKPITTLIKKDGAGKIGVFYIGADRAIIKTRNGTIIMDDDEGIRILDNEDNEKILVIPDDVETYAMPEKVDVETASSGGRIEVSSGNWVNPDYTAVIDINSNGAVDNHLEATFYLSVAAYCRYNGSTSSVSLTVSAVLQRWNSSNNDWDDIDTLGTYTKNETIPTDGEEYEILAAINITEQSPVVKNNLVDGYYRIQLRAQQTTSAPTRLVITSGWNWILSGYYYPAISAKTVIGTNGVIVANSRRKYFQVVNETTGQKVMMTGLPTSASGLSSGQIWRNSDNQLCIIP